MLMLDQESYTVNYDVCGDVLYVKMKDTVIKNSQHPEGDSFVIFNYNDNGEIVGLQLLDFSEATETYWNQFKTEVPPVLFSAVLNWIGSEK